MKHGWEIKKLSEIGTVFNGNSINEKIKKDKYTGLDKGLPFIATKDIGFDSVLDYENGVKIPYDERNQFKIAPTNTPLICAEGGSAGRKIGFTNTEVCFGNKLFAFVPNKGINSKYIYYYYFTVTFQEHFSIEKVGIIGGVSMNKFREIEIPIPPLSEQQLIVAILDEAFGAIAKAQANAEQNLKNAKEILESYVQEIFETKGDHWEEKKLGDVTNIQRGSSPRPKGDPKYFSKTKTKFNWITISDISSYCEDNVLLQTREWLTEAGSKQSRYVDENEFIIAVSGSTTGKCCITGIKGFIYDGLAVVKIINNKIEPRFLLNYMMSLYSTINNSKTGAAFPNINTNYLNNLPISLPSFKEQQTTVHNINVLRAETQKLEAVYQKKLDNLEELKKSILQKAFSGELSVEKAIAL